MESDQKQFESGRKWLPCYIPSENPWYKALKQRHSDQLNENSADPYLRKPLFSKTPASWEHTV